MERFGHYLLGLFAAVLLVTSNAAHAKRVAIIIANETYASEARLSNPVRDARAIAAALGPQGAKFDEVRLLIDLDQKGMKRAILAIADHTGADALVVYFSGHGIRNEHGHNFLLPVEAVINRPGDIEVEGVYAEDLILAVKNAQPKLGLIVLDACRNNPFTAAMGTRSATKGLMRRGGEGLSGVLVAYATEGGQVADDGRAGTGSPFAIAFARHIATPGTPLLALLDQIGDDVAASTGGKQTPTRDGNMRANAMLIPAVLNRPATAAPVVQASVDPTGSGARVAPPRIVPASVSTQVRPAIASVAQTIEGLGLKVQRDANSDGIRVTQVDKDGPAFSKMFSNDVIMRINGELVDSSVDPATAISEALAGQAAIRLGLKRGQVLVNAVLRPIEP